MATIQDAGVFPSGREFAAFLGLTPRQHSSGGKERLGRVTKMGDRYLRKLLVVGAWMRVRWPDEPPGTPWSTGSSVDYVRDLVGYWRDGFDWRAQETALNRFQQFKVPLGGIDLHFIHEEGKGPNPMPLLLSHGWPGSVVEFHKILPMLTDPARFGGDPRDSFTVVAPSLAGYTLSFAPGQKRFGVEEISELLAELMTDVLGYGQFAAQGGDWGAFITSRLGYQFPERIIGIHLNMLAVRRDPKMLENPTAEEKTFLGELNHFLKEETGYQWI